MTLIGIAETFAGVVSLILCVIGLIVAFLFCWDVGQYHIDMVDTFVATRGMTLIGIAETFALGWVYKIEDQYKAVGERAVKIWNYGYWGTLILSTLVSLLLAQRQEFGEGDDMTYDYEGVLGVYSVLVGLAMGIIGLSVSFFFALSAARDFLQGKGLGDAPTCDVLWGILGWYGAEEIRLYVNTQSDGNVKW